MEAGFWPLQASAPYLPQLMNGEVMKGLRRACSMCGSVTVSSEGGWAFSY